MRFFLCAGILLTSAALYSAEPATAQLKGLEQFKKACAAVGTPVVLVNVWAVNCSHCMDELSVLSTFAREQFKDSGELGFLSVCLADDSQPDFNTRYAAVLNRKKLTYATYVWSGDLTVLQKELRLDATPYTALFSSSGRLLDVLELPRGVKQAEEALRSALKKAASAK